MTEVRTAAAGIVDLHLAPSLASLADAVTSVRPGC
jgi:hypothetical protein